jgi:hypothetical protein
MTSAWVDPWEECCSSLRFFHFQLVNLPTHQGLSQILYPTS